MSDTLENAGQFWTEKEDSQLLEEINNNITIKDIALNHGRTECAINSRLKRIAILLIVNDNYSIQEASDKVKLSYNIINASYNKFLKKNDKDNDKDKFKDILIEIRDLLKIIANK